MAGAAANGSNVPDCGVCAGEHACIIERSMFCPVTMTAGTAALQPVALLHERRERSGAGAFGSRVRVGKQVADGLGDLGVGNLDDPLGAAHE